MKCNAMNALGAVTRWGAMASLLLACLPLAALSAQPNRPEDPLAAHLFPPELIMKHQREIALSEAQREAIRGTIQEAQSTFSGLQWDLESEMASLVDLIAHPSPEEQEVLAQLETILRTENEMKRAQLTLMVRLKNELTPQQQEELRRLQRNP